MITQVAMNQNITDVSERFNKMESGIEKEKTIGRSRTDKTYARPHTIHIT